MLHEFAAQQPPSDPAWSPKGKQLAFEQGSRLALICHDGARRPHLLPQLTHTEERPAWSRDGRRLAFIGRRCFNCPGWLYTVRSDGTSPRRVSSRIARAPAWSVTGRIAFVNDNDRPDALVGIEDGVYTVRPDGSGLRRLVRGRWAPDWSPDGQPDRLRHQQRDRHRPGRWRAPSAGDEAEEPLSPTDPVWSPDGRFLAFVVNGQDVYVVRSNGRGLRRVLNAGQDLAHPERSWDQLRTPTWQPLDRASRAGRIRPGR